MRSEDQTEEWLSIFVGRLRQDDRVRLRRLLAEVEAPESYWLAAQDRLTPRSGGALACAIVDVLRACYSGLPRTSATKMLAVDWKRYVAGDDWLREKKLAALPEGTRRNRIGLHRIARISDEPLSWQRIAEIARETP